MEVVGLVELWKDKRRRTKWEVGRMNSEESGEGVSTEEAKENLPVDWSGEKGSEKEKTVRGRQ